MSLTSALNSTLSGLQLNESRINVLSENVSNADKVGYTRKTLSTNYTSVDGRTVPLGSSIVTNNFNPYLLESIISDTGNASFNETMATYLSNYSVELGTIDGNNSLSAFTSNLATALDRLSVTPEDASLKSGVIYAADRLAVELRRTSSSIQDYRLQADQEIERTVDEINDATARIYALNQKIVEAEVNSKSTANLVDERNVELEELSKLINISYFTNSENEVQIYTNGRPLLDSRNRSIEYEGATNIDKTTLYPGGFNAIDLSGFDLTGTSDKGRLSALVNLRDNVFVEEQAKLDEFANVLSRELNALLNTGASIPPRPDMIGDVKNLTGATVLGATGSVRIATTDSNGVVQNFADIDLTTTADVNALILAINGALGPDVTASLDANGALNLVANNAGEGLALNQLDSALGGGDFSTFFGLNNIFHGTGANDIRVSQYLIDDGSRLATSTLNGGGTLAIGDTGVFAGDSSLTSQLNDAFSGSTSFSAAGNFFAQTTSLSNYIDSIIGDAAYRTDAAKTNQETSNILINQTKATLQNMSGVNVDEEMAHLIDLEAKYEASATMLRTIQEMFDALLGAVR